MDIEYDRIVKFLQEFIDSKQEHITLKQNDLVFMFDVREKFPNLKFKREIKMYKTGKGATFTLFVTQQ
jgi:hypothetical protein